MIDKEKSVFFILFMYQRYIKEFHEGSNDNNYVGEVGVIIHDIVYDL